MLPRFAFVIVYASSLLTVASWSALSRAEDQPLAEALFRSGRRAMKEGDYRTACLKFSESNRIDPSPGTQLNLGECEEKLGHLSAAWELYQRVVHALPPSDERQHIARADADALEPRLPLLTLVAADDLPSDAEIWSGEARLTTSSMAVPLPMDPGQHQLVVRARGRIPRTYRVSLALGERRRLVIAPGPLPVDPRAAQLMRERAGKWSWGVASLGVAGSAFVVAGVGSIAVLRKKGIVTDPQHCVAHACDAAGLRASEQGKAWSLVATVSASVGLTAAAAGIYLLFSRPAQATPAAATLRVGTELLRGGAGLTISRQY